MGGGDAVATRLEEVDQAARELRDELGALRGRMRTTRDLREQGCSLAEALARSPGPACHEVVAVRMTRLSQAVHDYRCAIVRHLVDVEGWSLSDIAAHTGNARQVVSRLYHACEGPGRGPCPHPKLQLHNPPVRRGVHPDCTSVIPRIDSAAPRLRPFVASGQRDRQGDRPRVPHGRL
jgi:hypothetical protein